MLNRTKIFKCPETGDSTEGLELEGNTFKAAMIVLGCENCSLIKAKRCIGPVVDIETSTKSAKVKGQKRKTTIQEGAAVKLPPNFGAIQMPRPEETQPPLIEPEAVAGTGTKSELKTPPIESPADKDAPPLSREEQCRQRLMELASVPKRTPTDEIVNTFHKEILAARVVGVSWGKISAILKEYGYIIGDTTLTRKMKGAGNAENRTEGGGGSWLS